MSNASAHETWQNLIVPRSRTNAADTTLTAGEFGKLVVKLRWIGADSQADALVCALAKVAPQGFVLITPRETD